VTRAWTGFHVLTTLIAIFAVAFAVNVLFVVKAYTTFRGEDEQKPYLQGIAYNDTLARRVSQARLGWKATIDSIRTRDAGVRIVVVIRDRSGAPVQNLILSAELKHPSDAERDRSVALRSAADGTYRGVAEDVHSGAWDVVVTARNTSTAPFQASRRIWLR
jgi:nitrogen fixation protein FixH